MNFTKKYKCDQWKSPGVGKNTFGTKVSLNRYECIYIIPKKPHVQ